jgi:hypothetical protein
MIHLLLELSNQYLIEFMGVVLGLCLIIRLIAFYSNKRNDGYFSTLVREIAVTIEKDKEDKVQIKDVDHYLAHFLSKISDKLPNRSLRFKKKESNPSGKKLMSIDGYLSGHENFVNILRAETGIFHCETPPNFNEITHRILGQDSNWTMILKKLPVDGVSRLIDIMPGLFVVFGVFGTFVGISMALPEIAKIDFNNIDGSAETLQVFVRNTAYAMETSLAGIVFSVVMTVMNALFPIKDMRSRILKKVETSIQTLWYHVHFSSNHESELLQTLKALNESIAKLQSHQGQVVTKVPGDDKAA